MRGEPITHVFPTGLEDEYPNGPPTVEMTHRGLKLRLRFAAGDLMGEGQVQELCLLPDTEALEPKALRRFAPQAEVYLAFARGAMRVLQPGGREKFRRAGEAFRDIAGPGRGLTDEFYNVIAQSYAALVAEGEKHPVKALSEIHHVTISAASRWLKEARRRGLIQEGGDSSAS